MLPFLLERILDEMPAWLYNNNMIKFLIPTAKEMKPSKEVPSQKLSEKSEAILTEMAKLSTDDLSIAYKIKPEHNLPLCLVSSQMHHTVQTLFCKDGFSGSPASCSESH